MGGGGNGIGGAFTFRYFMDAFHFYSKLGVIYLGAINYCETRDNEPSLGGHV